MLGFYRLRLTFKKFKMKYLRNGFRICCLEISWKITRFWMMNFNVRILGIRNNVMLSGCKKGIGALHFVRPLFGLIR